MEGVLVLLLRFLLVLFYSRVHTKVRGRVLFTWLMLWCKGRLYMNVSLILEGGREGWCLTMANLKRVQIIVITLFLPSQPPPFHKSRRLFTGAAHFDLIILWFHKGHNGRTIRTQRVVMAMRKWSAYTIYRLGNCSGGGSWIISSSYVAYPLRQTLPLLVALEDGKRTLV